MKKVGSLQGNDEFFAQLKPINSQKWYPPGRENLSFSMRNTLLNFEIDFNQLSNKADMIKHEVCKIYQEVFLEPTICDPCCSCRQTKKSHLLWHATKSPYQVIDAVFKNEYDNT